MGKSEKIRLYYGLFLTALTLLVGVLFIVETATVYFSAPEGTDPFTAELVGKRLSLLMIPVGIWIAAIVAGYVLSLVFPLQKKKLAAPRDKQKALKRLKEKLPDVGDTPENKRYKKFATLRLFTFLAAAVFGLVAAILCAVYLFNVSHFQAETTDEVRRAVLNMLKNVLPYVGAAFLLAVIAVEADGLFIREQLASAKKMIAGGKGLPLVKSKPCVLSRGQAVASKISDDRNVLLGIRLAVLIVGLVLLVLGIARGGAWDVLQKAIKICSECIGIG